MHLTWLEEWGLPIFGALLIIAAGPTARWRQQAFGQSDRDRLVNAVVMQVGGALLVAVWLIGRLTR